MKIKVVRVEENNVIFTCAVGTGVGKCLERNLMEGVIYDIEIDINTPIILDKNAKKNTNENMFLKIEGDVNLINGTVESIDDNDICLRLANDFIIIFDCIDSQISKGDILLMAVNKEDLELTLVGV